ncbi:hypothetical protein GQ43DRAFT_177152 [Delitschia confertaspora ATCC 74209]|uniref:Secreted protein n=1 Tax=Delitschia confertaspora ATCC 74209 TaxID=1513339 RepID=A0A9P4JTZ9_9PLEO|nr:hypothetical protein GQ43DRAFT_177152 [Delitschia confertaspora ATCC 74209]
MLRPTSTSLILLLFPVYTQGLSTFGRAGGSFFPPAWLAYAGRPGWATVVPISHTLRNLVDWARTIRCGQSITTNVWIVFGLSVMPRTTSYQPP